MAREIKEKDIWAHRKSGIEININQNKGHGLIYISEVKDVSNTSMTRSEDWIRENFDYSRTSEI